MREDYGEVTLTDSGVIYRRPDGRTESVTWDALRTVMIVTTDEGPFSPDFFWVLEGAGGSCAIPQEAAGEKSLMDRLGTLDGFDWDAVIAASQSIEINRFLCWTRPDTAP